MMQVETARGRYWSRKGILSPRPIARQTKSALSRYGTRRSKLCSHGEHILRDIGIKTDEKLSTMQHERREENPEADSHGKCVP
ncbi:hypothetical protein IEO21_05942 [Rhodonia placenta]|uniref:DUF1127 domain-containing protein n=1 Tax=Rhodonia placenta TaxID=104341 RepID=A0A8H7U1S5_9APHY|nr:hypothetical protein IEO21_05942 [Postia placenta]